MQTGRRDPLAGIIASPEQEFPGVALAGMGLGMTVSEKINAYLREVTGRDGNACLSDFQMRVRKDGVEIVNLKTRAVRVIKADESDDDEDFGDIR